MAAELEKLVARLESVTTRLESCASRGGSGGGGSAADDDPMWLDDFNAFYKEHMQPFLDATLALGGDLDAQGKLLKAAFEAHKNLITIAGRNNRPSAADLPSLLKPLSEGITAVQDFREKNRKSTQFNHLSAISEAVPFLGWVAVAPKPSQYIDQMKESAQFYSNKVLTEAKKSNDEKQTKWAQSLIKLLQETSKHVKEMHGTGLNWNKDKPAATASTVAGGSAPAPPSGPPPPGPPPPPPPAAPAGGSSASASAEVDRSQLFAQLNKGSDITSGLKKVTDDMKTHKNPALRNQPSAKSSVLSPRPYSPPKFKKFNNAQEVKKPPVFELQQKKWIVEYQENNQNLVIDNTNDKQTIYMFRCKNSVLQVKGKVNSIILDGCSKCGVVFDDLISTCEFVNCKSVKAQCNGAVPTVSIDKTDGAQIYLSEKNLDAQIISAKSSEMNICITKEDGDLVEFPIPEQYKTTYNPDTKKFETVTMDLNL